MFCVENNIAKLRPYLKYGMPEIGIPACDPFDVPDVVLDEGTKAINVTGRGTNIKLHGALNFHLDKF